MTMKRVEDYLKSKKADEFTGLDRCFELYISGEMQALLSKYNHVCIYPKIGKSSKSIQLNYNYCNIYVTFDFFEDKYCGTIYQAGIEANELEALFQDYNYPDDFDLKKLIDETDAKIKSHPKLKDTTLIEKKKKMYSLIAWISFCLPILIFGSIALYCVITENSVKGNMWWVIFIAVSLIFWFIFDIKSKRLK